jgi:CheY-like chemotaxis protein
VTVESSEEVGTTFSVRLPRRLGSNKSASNGDGARKILIVGDDEHIRASLREAFEEKGYDVATKSDGQEAIALLHHAEERPDVVLLDLALPATGGRRVYAEMQADAVLAKIPLIVATSTPMRAPPGVVVVSKPLKLERLLDAVADVCRDGA